MKIICNILTLIRLICAPVIALVFFKNEWLAFSIFIFACLTDYLDGKIARKYNFTSEFGEILDPIVDKVLIVTLLMLLTIKDFNLIIPGLIIIWRELIVNDLRFSKNVKSSKLSKIKTTTQMLAVALIMLPEQGYVSVYNLGMFVLWIAAALSIITGALHFLGKENK